jgi:hypothetical protein
MAKDAKQREARKRKRSGAESIPLEQVSPAVLTATRDVAYTLDKLRIAPQPEDVLKAVLERAEHLEEQASGITVIED